MSAQTGTVRRGWLSSTSALVEHRRHAEVPGFQLGRGNLSSVPVNRLSTLAKTDRASRLV